MRIVPRSVSCRRKVRLSRLTDTTVPSYSAADAAAGAASTAAATAVIRAMRFMEPASRGSKDCGGSITRTGATAGKLRVKDWCGGPHHASGRCHRARVEMSTMPRPRGPATIRGMLSISPLHSDVAALRDALVGSVVLPGDDGWDAARLAWNLAADQRPALVALPESAADVQALVDFARTRGLRIAMQGTGHNATPLGPLDDTLLVKTERMRAVEIDERNCVARVEAGALWIDVTAPASEAGLAPLAGSSPDVGVVGYTLGGGLSWLGRRYGLAANRLLSAEVVTADGRLVHASRHENPDLFWALRGGGGNFGAVVAIEFELIPMRQVHAGMMLFPWERAREVMQAWREWTAAVPDSVTTSARIMQLPPLPELPEFLRGRGAVIIHGAVVEGAERAAELPAPRR